MTTPKDGSIWQSAEGKEFQVIHTIVLEGKTWVHYRHTKTSTEHSCYVESFLERFHETLV